MPNAKRQTKHVTMVCTTTVRRVGDLLEERTSDRGFCKHLAAEETQKGHMNEADGVLRPAGGRKQRSKQRQHEARPQQPHHRHLPPGHVKRKKLHMVCRTADLTSTITCRQQAANMLRAIWTNATSDKQSMPAPNCTQAAQVQKRQQLA